MAKSGDNMLIWVLFLGAGLYFVYKRHENQEVEAHPAATPHALPPYGGVDASGGQFYGNIPFAIPAAKAAYAHHHHGHHGCSCRHDLGDVTTWEDADERAPMYAVPMNESYGDVGAIG
jgi:hypothetical protein